MKAIARSKETTIERIYREVTGNRMPVGVKRILLRKRKAKRLPELALVVA